MGKLIQSELLKINLTTINLMLEKYKLLKTNAPQDVVHVIDIVLEDCEVLKNMLMALE